MLSLHFFLFYSEFKKIVQLFKFNNVYRKKY